MFSIYFSVLFSRFAICFKSKVNTFDTCLSKTNVHTVHIAGEMEENGKNPSDIQLNLRSGCGRLPQPEWFSQTYLKKQYHMCKLIYEVLTLGPERISILLGKCFPLGSVSATAYRCFRNAEKARLFPPQHEWKSMLKVLPQPSSESDLQLILGCTLLSATFCTGQGFIWHRRYLVLLPWTPVHIVRCIFVSLAVL